jgi:uncharacterized SAM-binding protein YcdF (DUF218 family)
VANIAFDVNNQPGPHASSVLFSRRHAGGVRTAQVITRAHNSQPAATATVSRTRKRTTRLLCIVAVCLLSLFGLAWIGAKLLIVKSEMPSADAIVVLSGSSTYIERTAHAARLFREGRAPRVVLTNDGLLSGWNENEQRNPYFVDLAVKELKQHGVPADRIQIISGQAAGTFEEARLVGEFATSHSLKRLLIVTSAYHSRRALWSVRRNAQGIEVGIESPPPGWQTPSPSNWWLRRWGWTVVAGEYGKLAYYRLNY